MISENENENVVRSTLDKYSLSQTTLANILNVSQQCIGRYANGERETPAHIIELIRYIEKYTPGKFKNAEKAKPRGRPRSKPRCPKCDPNFVE